MHGLISPECTVRGGVDALAPVVPADPVTRVRVVADNLLDYSSPRAALGRLSLGENAISG
jgi:hypothetical protein